MALDFDKLLEAAKENYMSHIRPEIQALVADGKQVDSDTLKDLRMSSWEREFLIPHMTDEAFMYDLRMCLKNISEHSPWEKPCVTYDDYIARMGVMELIRRFVETKSQNKDAFLDQIISRHIPEDNNSDVFHLRFKDGGIHDGMTTPDISYEHFKNFLFKMGSSDSEYDKYLRDHRMHEITSFNSGGIEDLYLVLEDGFRQRRIVFKAIYDSDKEDEE